MVIGTAAHDTEARDTEAIEVRRRRRILVDSGWILLGYAVTSGAGFVFWVLSARLVEPAELGVQTAIYSLVTAAAAIASSGIGDALLVMLPVSGASRHRLLRRGVTGTLVLGAAAGLVAGLLASAFVPTGLPAPLLVVLVTASSTVWALFVIKDPILQALGRSNWATALNGPMNVVKLALLPALVLAVTTPAPVLLAIGLPVLVAVAVAYTRLIPRAVGTPLSTPDTDVDWYRENTGEFRAFALRMGIAGGLYLGLALSLPFLVTALAGPVQGATFALCFQFALALDLVALAVGASFSTHSAADDSGGNRSVLGAWLRVLGVVALGAIALTAASPLILGFMGQSYLDTGGVALIAVLGLAAVLRTSYEMWGASLRARRRSVAILVSSISQAPVLLIVAVLVVPAHGAMGAGWSMLAVTAALSIVGFVGILRAHRAA